MNGFRIDRAVVRFCCFLLLAVAMVSVASAQFFYFGRNKIQYTDFEWHVLKTQHFDIYYYPEMQALAERGAYFAEESYKLLETKFNHTLNSRVPLIFYSSHLHFEQTNTTGGFIPEGVGGFFEFLKGRVVIPADGLMTGKVEWRARSVKADMILRMEHGKPLLFGKDNKKGIRFNAQSAELEVVTIGQNGVTEKDILVHDAKRDDPTIAFMLANLSEKPGFPTPIGIFRNVEQPTCDELNWQQINAAKQKKGDVSLRKFLSGGDTWTVK